MSVKAAFQFIQKIQNDPDLKNRLDQSAGLGGIVSVGLELGYQFTEEQLREAFARDTAMRRRFYGGASKRRLSR